MDKKGQAAMEFLMTYGWAILAAVIAIGALAYFGVFSPGKSLPSVCTINTPLGCEEHSVNTTNVRIIARNGAGDSITISNFSVSNCGSTSGITVVDGGTADVVLACSPGSVGSKFRGDISVTYLKSGATITQKATGTINAEIQ